jgi:antitoxin MazE
METVIKRWGNSLALRLPRAMAADLRLVEGATVSLTVEDRALVVKPARKRYRLADLLAPMDDRKKHAETDWGKLEGDEAW